MTSLTVKEENAMKKRAEKARAELESREVSIYWDYDDKLHEDHVKEIIKGDLGKVYESIWDSCIDYIGELESKERAQVADQFDVEYDQLWDTYPTVEFDIKRLVKNTHAKLGVTLGINHDNDTSTFGAVRNELEALGINPAAVRESWPSIPERSDPLVSNDDLWELWVNNFYPGEYTALLDPKSLQLLADNPEAETFTLKAGSPVTIYDFWNGSGSMIVETQKDITVKRENIYHDGANRYGIQRCYGLVDSAWAGELIL